MKGKGTKQQRGKGGEGREGRGGEGREGGRGGGKGGYGPPPMEIPGYAAAAVAKL
jgi:hypothetical protein